jgi:hypothetical protein
MRYISFIFLFHSNKHLPSLHIPASHPHPSKNMHVNTHIATYTQLFMVLHCHKHKHNNIHEGKTNNTVQVPCTHKSQSVKKTAANFRLIHYTTGLQIHARRQTANTSHKPNSRMLNSIEISRIINARH